MRIVYDPSHVRHQPRTELLYGRPIAHPDRPERVEAIMEALRPRWERAFVTPRDYPLGMAASVHEPAYIEFLAARELEDGAAPPDEEWFPYTWPAHRSLDTGTPLLGITRDVAWASACVAVTAADLVTDGERSVYALCRPPGHHASRGAMGGYCYFNNAALAAKRLVNATVLADRQSGDARVAILDLDIHHGNGTQDIFYADDRVLYCSIHGHPDWAYPPHSGWSDEVGEQAGHGWTYNQPLDQGVAWPQYGAALERALERIVAAGAAAVVVSQGFDTFAGDRWGGFALVKDDFARVGARLKALGLPLVVVLEGGYEAANLAAGSAALLDGLEH